jgi:hypothetical protein
MSIIMDAMDQQKCHVPHLQGSSKTWDAATRLEMQYGALIMHGVGTRMFAWDENLKKDSNLWASIMLKCIMDEKAKRDSEGKKWPHTLYIQADNAKDNKNKALYALCELLVKLGVFRKIKISFLPVGHTHEDVDANFGCGSHQLHRHDAFTLADVAKLWRQGWPSTKSFEYIFVG